MSYLVETPYFENLFCSMKRKYSPKKIFIVEDDPIYIKIIKYVLELDPEHEVHVFTSGKECIDHLYLNPIIVTLDYSLSDLNGDEVMSAIKKYNPNIGIVVLSAQKDISIAVDFMKEGAFLYLEKDKNTKDKLLLSIQQLKKQLQLQQEIDALKSELENKYDFDNNLIGKSKPMQRVQNLISKAIKTNISVTIHGETGTGKEVVARTIHYSSTRRKGKFVAVNLTAIPTELLESELFGYEKGAFTGATTRKIGKFELANKGTLFLDEIAEMDITLQSKILRALQEREITRVGGNQVIKFDARLIVATHRNLADEVAKGNFREDLYYRLLGLPIETPPLRERGTDIFLLADHFLKMFCVSNHIPLKKLTKEAKEKLNTHPFPGNIRELKAVIDLAVAISETKDIQAEDIQFSNPQRHEVLMSNEMSLKKYNQKIIHHFLEKYNN
ncbi:MAG TPA: sigma-54-dependent Fis family transcriptional regulator, partial [Phaeodactylibacter sp.]|nr:sigma-54-dependent Fis family transcriptional regulator [Phaeodactylibacter sp.]